MKKISLVIAVVALIGIASLAHAQPAQAQLPGVLRDVISTLISPRPTLTPQPADERPQFLYGSEIAITQEVKGDLIVAGGRVTIDAPVGGDLLVAGGLVQINAPISGDVLGLGGLMNFSGNVDNDVRVAGIGMNFDSVIAKNAMIASAFLRQANRSAINGSLRTYVYRAWLNGVIGGNLDITGTDVVLDASVGGTASVQSKNLTVEKNAQFMEGVNATLLVTPTVDPNAKLSTPIDLTIREAATPAAAPVETPSETPTVEQQSFFPLVGVVHAQEESIFDQIENRSRNSADSELEKQEDEVNKGMRRFFGSVLVTLIGGSFMLWLFPTFQQGQVMVLEKKTALTAVAGWLWIFMGLLAGLLLLITIIGAPIGIALLLIWTATMIMAPWAVAQAFGHLVVRKWQSDSTILRSSYFHLLVGAVLLAILMLLPYIGWTVRLIVWTLGMGAPVYWLLNKPQVQAVTVPVTTEVAAKPSKKRSAKKSA